MTAECPGSLSEVVDAPGVAKGLAVSGSGSSSTTVSGTNSGLSMSSSGTESSVLRRAWCAPLPWEACFERRLDHS